MEIPIENYKALALEVVKQAVIDYLNGEGSFISLSNFMHNSVFVQCLDLDPDYVLEQARERKFLIDGKKAKGKAA